MDDHETDKMRRAEWMREQMRPSECFGKPVTSESTGAAGMFVHADFERRRIAELEADLVVATETAEIAIRERDEARAWVRTLTRVLKEMSEAGARE